MSEDRQPYSQHLDRLMREKLESLKPWEEVVYKEGFLAGTRFVRLEDLLHPAWTEFIRYCSFGGDLKGFGTITSLTIQHGLP